MATLAVGLAHFQHTGGGCLRDDAAFLCIAAGLALIAIALLHLRKPVPSGLALFGD